VHTLIIVVAKYFIALPVLLAGFQCIRLAKAQRLSFVVEIVAGGLLSLVLAFAASKFIHDPRPFVQGHFVPLIRHGTDNGFPSDHTLLAAYLGWTILIFSRPLGIGALLIALMIGSARMAAGIHHSWDIVGSFVISGMATAATYIAVQYMKSKQPRRRGAIDRGN